MKTKNPNEKIHDAIGEPSIRRPVRIALWSLGLAFLVILAGVFLRGRAPHDRQPSASRDLTTSPTTPRPVRPHREIAADQQTPPARPVYQQPEPTPAMRRLVGSLVNFDSATGPLSEEQALNWRTNFQALIQQGADAVPAIAEFLGRNVDLAFSSEDQGMLGYSSPRAAMLDALAQIGGPAAVNTMAQVLQTAADPREIAFLSQNLEKLDPGVHRQEMLDAARESLGMAAQGNLPGRDVAPLFEVLQQFGGANAVADLERTAAQWNFYAMIGLAQLPDGAGVLSLIQMAESPDAAGVGIRIPALETLAQLASQSPNARTALVEEARQNKITAYEWAALAPFLAGNQMVFQNSAFGNGLGAINPNELTKTMISIGNQSFMTAPLGAMTPDQIKQQTALVDELLAATSDPDATQALERSKAMLSRRLIQVAAAEK